MPAKRPTDQQEESFVNRHEVTLAEAECFCKDTWVPLSMEEADTPFFKLS